MNALYDFNIIEQKWQSIWKEANAYATSDDFSLPKYYILVEFPYPSGKGLHVGHPRSYVAMDVVARKRRMEGFNVLFPIGWDAFGLPAENFAIQTGQHPKDVTIQNTSNFKEQLTKIGCSFDWSRELNTTDPEYYTWTQWIFLRLWDKGLAYKAEIAVNWCSACKVGLANEEVVSGKCERCGSTVVRRMQKQWMLKITDYAERLINDIDTVDYLEKIKTQQVNWIGKSIGAEISFDISGFPKSNITVYTTRPDTIFGVTYLALAPENPIINDFLGLCTNADDIRKYIENSEKKSDFERSELAKEITGVEIKGIHAINPINNAKIPIWVADYVLMGYGTGALMAVPAHDTRDWNFAHKYDLPIIQVISSNGNNCNLPITETHGNVLQNSGFIDGLSPSEASKDVISMLEQNGCGKSAIKYKLRDWVFSRQRFWGEPIPIVDCEECGLVPLPDEDLPLLLPEVDTYTQTQNGESPLALIHNWVNTSCPKCGGTAKRETDTMPQWAGSSWYFLRYCDPKNNTQLASKKNLDYWMPVDWYNGGMEHTTLHLLYSRFWHKFLYDIGIVATPEPYQKRTSHGLILGENGEKMSKSRGNCINPDDVITKYGADSFRLYELFIGAFDQPIPWSMNGLNGMHRFLNKVWRMQSVVNELQGEETEDDLYVLDQTIQDVTERVECMKFNTAISSLIEFINYFSKKGSIPVSIWKEFIKLSSPFAPHICHELWGGRNENTQLYREKWPTPRNTSCSKSQFEVPVQINGILRGKIAIDNIGITDDSLTIQAKKAIEQKLANTTIKRCIIVRKNNSILVNFVVVAD